MKARDSGRLPVPSRTVYASDNLLFLTGSESFQGLGTIVGTSPWKPTVLHLTRNLEVTFTMPLSR